MKKFQLHVLKDILTTFFFCLATFALAIVVLGVIWQAVREGVPILHAIRLLPYLVPFAMYIAIPIAFLLSVTTVFSRMAGYNEFMALKSLGISPFPLIWPVFVLAAVLSLITIVANDFAVSWGRRGAERVILGAGEEIVYRVLSSSGEFKASNLTITVQGVEGRKLLGVRYVMENPSITAEADEARLECDLEEGVLQIWLQNGRITSEGDVRGQVEFLGEKPEKLAISLSEVSSAGGSSDRPADMGFFEIAAEKEKQREAKRRLEREQSISTAFYLAMGDMRVLEEERQAKWQQKLDAMEHRRARLMTETPRRTAFGFSCFFFVWVGAPMAIKWRRREVTANFFLCFGPILLVYYPLLLLGLDASKNGILPPGVIWIGNILFGAVGSVLLYIVVKR